MQAAATVIAIAIAIDAVIVVAVITLIESLLKGIKPGGGLTIAGQRDRGSG